MRFYEALYSHPALVQHCPLFLGTRSIKPRRKGEPQDTHHREGCDVEICLEDLTHRFYKPCVCDIKMGNVQHGHDATPSKATRSFEKCRRTTSRKLGFRLCGMKVWQPGTAVYASADKYEGRRVRAEDIDFAVGSFFHNGEELRRDAVAMIEEKVSALLDTMRQHEAHRFYSASVLLIYEGDPDAPRRCDVKLIDFAHTARVSEIPSMQGRCGPDNGLLLGLIRLNETLVRLRDGDGESFRLMDGMITSGEATSGATTTENETTTDCAGCDEGETDYPTTDYGGNEEDEVENRELAGSEEPWENPNPKLMWEEDACVWDEVEQGEDRPRRKKTPKKKTAKEARKKAHFAQGSASGESESGSSDSASESTSELEM